MAVSVFTAFARFSPAALLSSVGFGAFNHNGPGSFTLKLNAPLDPIEAQITVTPENNGVVPAAQINPGNHLEVLVTFADGGGSPIDPVTATVSVTQIRGVQQRGAAAHP